MFDQLDDPQAFVADEAFRASVDRRSRQLGHRRTGRRVAMAAVLPLLLLGGWVGRVGWNLHDIQRIHVAGTGGIGVDPLERGAPTTVLFVGRDGGRHDPTRAQVVGERSDTIVVVRIDPSAGHVSILSIPAELWTGSAKLDALDPSHLTIWLQDNLGIHVDHYVALDLDGALRLATLVQPRVRIESAVRDSTTGLRLMAGCQTLSGSQTLAYVRSRHLQARVGGKWLPDPSGPLGRDLRVNSLFGAVWAQLQGLGPTDMAITASDVARTATVDDRMSSADLLRLAEVLRRAAPSPLTVLPVRGGSVPMPNMAPAEDHYAESVFVPEPGPATDTAVAAVGGHVPSGGSGAPAHVEGGGFPVPDSDADTNLMGQVTGC